VAKRIKKGKQEMKTTSEELEKMSYEWCLEANDEHLDPRDFYPSPQSMDAFKAGFKACEAKMLAESVESFEEWKEQGIRSVIGMSENSARLVLGDYFTAESCFTAGAMSQAKRDAEEIERLKKAIHYYERHVQHHIDHPDEKPAVTLKYAIGAKREAEKALKQGGEK
jgi:hypothetical protein